MNFEFAKINQPPVTIEYKPHDEVADGEGLLLTLNLSLLTIARMEEMESEFQDTLKKAEESTDEAVKESVSIFYFEKANMRFKARMLGGKQGENNPEDRYIRDWNVVQKGKKLPISYEVFVNMDKNVLNNLYDFVTSEAGRPKKTKSSK